MRKSWVLGIGLLIMLLLIPDVVYAETLNEVNGARKILKIGTGIIIGFVVFGVMATVGGQILDIARMSRLKIYMETTVYLIALLVVISFFILVITKVKSISGM